MRINIVAFSTNGCITAKKVADALSNEDVSLFSKTSSDNLGLKPIEGKVKDWVGSCFDECDAIVFIGAVGIAVRYIAPFVRSKDTDPAVVALDEHGMWAISLLSGHIGGSNALTERIASGIGAEPIITTATDLNGKFSVDTFAVRNNLRISSLKIAKDVSARVLDGRFVGFRSDIPVQGTIPDGITPSEAGELGVSISYDPVSEPFGTTLNLTPMDIVLGIGCKRDTDPGKLESFVREQLTALGIPWQRVGIVSSIDIKKDEQAIIRLASSLRIPFIHYTSEELNSVEGEFSSSKFVRSVTDVDCVCERSAAKASGGNDFILRKTARDGMTIAVCRRTIEPRFV